MKPLHERILITGANGKLGNELRSALAPLAKNLRLTGRGPGPKGKTAPNEEYVPCELSDFDAVRNITRDVDAIVHFGGAPLESPWQVVLDSSIRGSYHIYESARQNGVRRIVYASSTHAVGFYRVDEVPDTRVTHRPDSLYGVSKCFVEDLSRLYFDKFGLESVCLRIGSCVPEPTDRRMLVAWLSYSDLGEAVRRALMAPRVGHSILYAVSDNHGVAVSNVHASHVGFKPADSSEQFRAAVEAKTPPLDPEEPQAKYIGGWFCGLPHPDDPPQK